MNSGREEEGEEVVKREEGEYVPSYEHLRRAFALKEGIGRNGGEIRQRARGKKKERKRCSQTEREGERQADILYTHSSCVYVHALNFVCMFVGSCVCVYKYLYTSEHNLFCYGND